MQKFTVNVVVGLLGNESPDSNRLTLVTPKSENDVRLQATLGNQNPTGLPVGVVRVSTAVRIGAECIVTRNVKDFRNVEIPVYTPEQFLDMMDNMDEEID